MTKNDIPPEVRRFILTSIPSVPHMEALMLLRATAPGRWTAHGLSQRLYVPTATAARVLDDLHGSGLLLFDDAGATYYYQSAQNAISETIGQMAALYASNLVEITLLIHSKLDRKGQQFADAFDLRKDAKDG